MKHNTYFYKIMIILLLVSILPFIFANIYSVSLLQSQSTELINKINNDELAYTGSIIDRTFNKIKDNIINSINAEVKGKNTLSVYDLNSIIDQMEVIQKLTIMYMSNEYFDSVSYYNSDKGYILSSNNGIVRDINQSYPWLESIIKSNLLDRNEIEVVDTQLPVTDKGKYIIAVIEKLPTIFNNSKYFIFNIDIQKIYNDTVKNLDGNGGIYKYYIINSTGKIVFDKDTRKINTSSKYPIQSNGSIYRNNDLTVNTYKLSNVDWYFISEVNTHKLYQNIYILRNRILIYDMIILVIIIVMALISSKYLYRPLNSTMTKIKDLFKINKYGKEYEFDLINNVVDDIAGRNTYLEDALEKSECHMKTTVLYNIIKYGYINKKEYDKYLNEYIMGDYVIVYFKKSLKSNMEVSYDKLESLMFGIKPNIIKSDLFKENEDEFIALFRLNSSNINDFIVLLIDSMGKEKGFIDNIIIGIGKIYNDIRKIHNSYTEALYAYNMGRISAEENNIFCYNKLPVDYNARNMNDVIIIELETAVRQGNEAKYAKLLEDMFNNNLSLVEYNYNLHITISLLIKLYKNNSVDFLSEINEFVMNNSIMNTIFLKDYLYSKFRSLANETKTEDNTVCYINKINEYIEKNYVNSFSTEDIAQFAGINKQYICNLIKQRYNTTFIDYLNIFRIEKAKQLLTDDSSKISDVYNEVGFSSISYFSKVFKRYTGVTPSEYRDFYLYRNEQ